MEIFLSVEIFFCRPEKKVLSVGRKMSVGKKKLMSVRIFLSVKIFSLVGEKSLSFGKKIVGWNKLFGLLAEGSPWHLEKFRAKNRKTQCPTRDQKERKKPPSARSQYPVLIRVGQTHLVLSTASQRKMLGPGWN